MANAKWISERVASEILSRATKTLQKDRLTGGGPPYFKFNGSVRYLDDPTGKRRDSLQHWAQGNVVRCDSVKPPK